jgi:hypothetical protein
VCTRFNGGSPDHDVFIQQPNILNANAVPLSPYIVFESNEIVDGEPVTYAIGDNPNTLQIENFATACKINLYDDARWGQALTDFGFNFTNDPPIPENMTTVPAPSREDHFKLGSNIFFHEFVHNVQQCSATTTLYDVEGNAVGFELIPTVNQGGLNCRSNRYSQYFSSFVRGIFPLMEDTARIAAPFNVSSYGAGIWYNFLYSKYDGNQQSMRRAFDLLSTKYALYLKSVGVQTFIENSVGQSTYGGAMRLAMKQALKELLNLELSDIFRDYAISLAVFRNNQSIPQKYRTMTAYWINSTYYPYANQFIWMPLPNPAYTYWWTELDTNQVGGPAITATGFPFVTYYPQLATTAVRQLNLQDLSTFAYVVGNNINSVTVAITKGTFAVSLVQFTPGGPCNEGTFVIDGPHNLIAGQSIALNVTPFRVNTGFVKLVISNLTITDWGLVYGDPIYDMTQLPAGGSRVTGTATVTPSA